MHQSAELRELFVEHRTYLIGCARKMRVEDGEIDDLLAELFIEASKTEERIGRILNARTPRSYLGRMFTRLIGRRWKRTARIQEKHAKYVDELRREGPKVAEVVALNDLATREENEALENCLHSLAEKERTLLVKVFVEGRKKSEIARELRITKSAVTNQIKIAQKHIRQCIEKAGFGNG